MLNDFSVMDWQLAGLVCQVLWNYSTNIRSSNQTFGEQESQALITLLNDYIGKYPTETLLVRIFTIFSFQVNRYFYFSYLGFSSGDNGEN